MCGGVMFMHEEKLIKTYFPNPKSTLPVKMKGNNNKLIPWGRRKDQKGGLPLGGWARLDSIESGVWDKYFPVPVKLSIGEFMEKDQATGASHWFTVTEGSFIQGLIARNNHEVRVYVVTIAPTETEIHDRWPRILADNK